MRKAGLEAVAMMACAGLAMAQGSLTPPGPPAPVMRTLDEIVPRVPIQSVPFTISQPGAYYLTGNLSGTTSGITIASSDVHLDLAGFVLSGDKLVFGHGIIVVPSDKVTIQGGVIRDWGGNGIEAPGCTNLTLESLRLRGQHVHGVHMGSGRLIDVQSEHNGGAGVFASKPVPGIGVIVKKHPNGSHLRYNGGGGLVLEGDCDVEFSGTIYGNTGHGISWTPIDPGDRITFKAKEGASVHNTGDGFHVSVPGEVDADCDFADFSFRDNGGDGVHISLPHPDSRLDIVYDRGRADGNGDDGLDITAGLSGRQGFFDVAMARNSDAGCNKVDGGSNPGTFSRCVVQDNGGPGLDLVGGSWTLEHSVVKNNGSDGVAVGALKHTKTGHVTLLKRTSTVEDNAGDGVRVYPAEDEAEVRVVVQDSRCSGNASNGLHVLADLPGSSITLDWLDSSASGNGGSGMLIVPVAMDKGLRFRAEGGDCDDNVAGGLTVAGDAVDAAVVRGLALRGNGTWGARVTGGSWRFERCVASGNIEGGFRMEEPAAAYLGRACDYALDDCDALNNGLAGIAVYQFDAAITARVEIAGGRVAGNSPTGIDTSSSTASRGRVHGVAVSGNGIHGIYCEGSQWSITDNRVAGNGGTGIFLAGDGHHVARNECVENAIGIYAQGTGSAVRENTFSGAGQVPYTDGSGANQAAPPQNVVTGVNPLGNVEF